MIAGRLAGHYYNALGTASFLWMIVGPILGNSLIIDFSFILFFWIGMGLLNGRSGRRMLAMILTSLAVLFSVGYLVILLWTSGPVPGGVRELRTPQLAAVHAGIILLLFLPPLILLLLPGTRRWFAEMKETPTAGYSLTRGTVALYVLTAMVPIAGGVALERATGRVTPSGFTRAFDFADGKLGIASAGWMEDETTRRPLFISWLAFGEGNVYGSEQDGHVMIGRHRIPVPNSKPVRYLLSPPTDESRAGNVMIVSEDGTVIRVSRLVTPEKLASACEAASGAKDLEELRKRLEALLPSAEVASANQ